jgi:dienelactone hydrolase
MQRVGAFGHSFGGAASLRLCGLDPRVKAAVNLDGWTFGALATRTSAQNVMILYEGAQLLQEKSEQKRTAAKPVILQTVQQQLDEADITAVAASLHNFGGLELYIDGTQHLDFSDQPLLPPLRRSATGPIAPQRIVAITRALVLAFFDESLRGTPAPWLNDPHTRFAEVSGGRVAAGTPQP